MFLSIYTDFPLWPVLDTNSPGSLGILASPKVEATEIQLKNAAFTSRGLLGPHTPTASSRFETLDSKHLQIPPPRQNWKFIHLLKARIVRRMKKWRYHISAKRKSSQQNGEDAYIKDMLLFKGGESQTTTFRRVRMDTCAPRNLVTQRSLIGVEHEMDNTSFVIVSLMGKLDPLGAVRLRWVFRGEDVIHEDEFFVLPDIAQADFDVLLGKDFMTRNGYRLQNNAV